MNNQDYEQKKKKCWEAFKKENLDGEIQWQPVSRYDVFSYAFDRAYALGKQEKDVEEPSLWGHLTDISSKERTMDKDEKFKPVEYEPIGCKNYPDIMDAVGAQLTRKYGRPYYDKRSETIKETLI